MFSVFPVKSGSAAVAAADAAALGLAGAPTPARGAWHAAETIARAVTAAKKVFTVAPPRSSWAGGYARGSPPWAFFAQRTPRLRPGHPPPLLIRLGDEVGHGDGPALLVDGDEHQIGAR